MHLVATSGLLFHFFVYFSFNSLTHEVWEKLQEENIHILGEFYV